MLPGMSSGDVMTATSLHVCPTASHSPSPPSHQHTQPPQVKHACRILCEYQTLISSSLPQQSLHACPRRSCLQGCMPSPSAQNCGCESGGLADVNSNGTFQSKEGRKLFQWSHSATRPHSRRDHPPKDGAMAETAEVMQVVCLARKWICRL